MKNEGIKVFKTGTINGQKKKEWLNRQLLDDPDFRDRVLTRLFEYKSVFLTEDGTCFNSYIEYAKSRFGSSGNSYPPEGVVVLILEVESSSGENGWGEMWVFGSQSELIPIPKALRIDDKQKKALEHRIALTSHVLGRKAYSFAKYCQNQIKYKKGIERDDPIQLAELAFTQLRIRGNNISKGKRRVMRLLVVKSGVTVPEGEIQKNFAMIPYIIQREALTLLSPNQLDHIHRFTHFSITLNDIEASTLADLMFEKKLKDSEVHHLKLLLTYHSSFRDRVMPELLARFSLKEATRKKLKGAVLASIGISLRGLFLSDDPESYQDFADELWEEELNFSTQQKLKKSFLEEAFGSEETASNHMVRWAIQEDARNEIRNAVESKMGKYSSRTRKVGIAIAVSLGVIAGIVWLVSILFMHQSEGLSKKDIAEDSIQVTPFFQHLEGFNGWQAEESLAREFFEKRIAHRELEEDTFERQTPIVLHRLHCSSSRLFSPPRIVFFGEKDSTQVEPYHRDRISDTKYWAPIVLSTPDVDRNDQQIDSILRNPLSLGNDGIQRIKDNDQENDFFDIESSSIHLQGAGSIGGIRTCLASVAHISREKENTRLFPRIASFFDASLMAYSSSMASSLIEEHSLDLVIAFDSILAEDSLLWITNEVLLLPSELSEMSRFEELSPEDTLWYSVVCDTLSQGGKIGNFWPVLYFSYENKIEVKDCLGCWSRLENDLLFSVLSSPELILVYLTHAHWGCFLGRYP